MTTSVSPWKPHDILEPNPIRIEQATAKEVAAQLDEHLAALFTLFHQYQKHHWLVEGPQFREIHVLLQESYTQIHEHADEVAERMTALGAVPTSSPTKQAELSYIEHEPEGVFRIREMLERDREAEGNLAERLRHTIRLCFERGDYGSETLLRKVLLEAEDRAHHLDHLLGGDSLDLNLPAEN
ncbi:MAG: DNA starvation/stationary phase protection protein DpsA [Planctomycetota bacterium]|jgi:DNA-binding ferritin-like protein